MQYRATPNLGNSGPSLCGDYICGDVNGNGHKDVSDLTSINRYMFSDGAPPQPYWAGDVNCSDAVDISDVVYLCNWMFRDGPEPCANCPGGSGKLAAVNVALNTTVHDDRIDITLESDVNVVALELFFEKPVAAQTVTTGVQDLDVRIIEDGSSHRAVLCNPEFGVRVPADGRTVISVPVGNALMFATAHDAQAHSHRVDLTNAGKLSLPEDFVLHQNYPNPFNPSTDICYSLPARAHVSIDIFNILGQKVRTLVDESRDAGEHTATWDGADGGGKPTSTGVYFYHMTVGDRSESKKMLLRK